jgi:hypothetical protein
MVLMLLFMLVNPKHKHLSLLLFLLLQWKSKREYMITIAINNILLVNDNKYYKYVNSY